MYWFTKNWNLVYFIKLNVISQLKITFCMLAKSVNRKFFIKSAGFVKSFRGFKASRGLESPEQEDFHLLDAGTRSFHQAFFRLASAEQQLSREFGGRGHSQNSLQKDYLPPELFGSFRSAGYYFARLLSEAEHHRIWDYRWNLDLRSWQIFNYISFSVSW